MSNMKAKVFNNWLPEGLNQYLTNVFLYNTPHYWGHTSNAGESSFTFYTGFLNPQDLLYNYLFLKFCETARKRLELLRMYINIQHPGMKGGPHVDDGELSGVYMVTPTQEVGSGTLHVDTGDGNYEDIRFERNKLVIFGAQQKHWADAPSKDPRITLTFKTREVKNGNN